MDYETVIGLEVHVQLSTVTKMFCAAGTSFGQEPNSQVDVYTLGLPGALPVVNGAAVELAVKAALALGCTVHEHSKFDRKHYFYPDMPKGYQTTQYDEPYCTGGGLHIVGADGQAKFVRLTRIHMEEDAGKLVHQDNGPWSEVDLNRSGTPLCEVVSEPEMRSAQEAHAFLTQLKRALKWVGVSDCEMQEGSLRCDANVSIRPVGQTTYGTRVEIKNLNSFKAVEAAIEYESGLHMALHRAGRYGEIIQCTKLWEPDSKTTRIMRSKEDAADYRYFPCPDLPALVIPAAEVERIRAAMPELPVAREARFMAEFGLEKAAAADLTLERPVAEYFEALVARGCPAKGAANWTREEALRLANEAKLPLTEAAPLDTMAELVRLVSDGTVARVVAKAAVSELFASGEAPTKFFTDRGQIQVKDSGALTAAVTQAIAQEVKAVEDIKAGKMNAVGRLVGVTMKLGGGRLNPADVKVELGRQLGVSW
jgi:aspartyl-tRNA(Asn)/glutamyl-tRNA(Gln) amidotransferase subunit B